MLLVVAGDNDSDGGDMVMREATYEDQPVTTVASAATGALHGAALADISQPDTVSTRMIALASERGFDRFVELLGPRLRSDQRTALWGAPGDTEHARTRRALGPRPATE